MKKQPLWKGTSERGTAEITGVEMVIRMRITGRVIAYSHMSITIIDIPPGMEEPPTQYFILLEGGRQLRAMYNALPSLLDGTGSLGEVVTFNCYHNPMNDDTCLAPPEEQ